MGVDFVAVIEHRLSWEELYALPDRLNAGWPSSGGPGTRSTAHSAERGVAWRWSRGAMSSSIREELFNENCAWLEGPAEFSGTVYKRAVALNHTARWWSFLEDREIRSELRRAARRVASVTNGNLIIYVPDSSGVLEELFQGLDAGEALAWLHADVGKAVDVALWDETPPGDDDREDLFLTEWVDDAS